MSDSFVRMMSNFGTFLLMVALVMVITMMSAFGFRYLEVYKINEDIENMMSDLLDYAALHNGFNDPVNGTYSFNQVVSEKIEEYKLDGKIQGNIQFNPAPGIDARQRTEELSITVTPIFPVLQPWSRTTRVGKPKVSYSLTHGYVKVTGQDKSGLIDQEVKDIGP